MHWQNFRDLGGSVQGERIEISTGFFSIFSKKYEGSLLLSEKKSENCYRFQKRGAGVK